MTAAAVQTPAPQPPPDTTAGAKAVAAAAAAPASADASAAAVGNATAPGVNAPSDAECKAGYPAGVLVSEVDTVNFRDLAPQAGERPGATEAAELRNGLEIKVDKLAALVRLLDCGDKKRRLVLFLAGRPLPGLTAYPPSDPAKNAVVFLLERKPASYEAWTHILGRPAIKPVLLQVSMGFEDSYPIPSDKQVYFRAIPVFWCWLWVLVIAMFAGFVLWAAQKTTMLRDSGVVAGGAPPMYSLARVQLTFWTFIILGSFTFIGLITGDYLHSMNENVLALLGISVGASLGSSIIDSGVAGTAARSALPTTGYWWRDIMTDGTNISIHRFQMAAWTLVLGIVFLHQVYSTLAMPEFDATLLGLLGISAGTYLSLKVTAESPPKADGGGAAAAAAPVTPVAPLAPIANVAVNPPTPTSPQG